MRDITQLHPRLQLLCADLVRECEKCGLIIKIGECVRTVAEQEALYAQGRTVPGQKVTNARGTSYSSQHQWGVAFDFYRADGKGAFYNDDSFFQRVGAIGKLLGLGWGGDWRTPVDMPHFYLKDWGSTTTQLKNIYGTPEKFMRTWPVANATPANTHATAPQTTASTGGFTLTIEKTTVKTGTRGADTKLMQILLNGYGYSCGTADGIAGAKTDSAIRAFQKANNLTVDGVAGAKTWTAILSVK